MFASRRVLLAVTLPLLAAAPAAAQGFSIAGPDSSRLTLTGRVQTQFTTSSVSDVPATEMVLRRARLEATLKLNPMVGGRISAEFAGSRVGVRDAYVRLKLDTGLVVLAGQAHRPFGIFQPLSSLRSLPIERGVRIRGLQGAWDEQALLTDLAYADRDVGLQLRGDPVGAPLGLSYAVGWFNGPLRSQFPGENTSQVAARVAVRPHPSVRAGLSYSARDFGAEDEATEQVDVERGQAWAADLELGSERGGPHALAEAAYGDFDPFAGAKFFGAQAWFGYRFGAVSRRISGVEPLLRVSYGDPDVNDDVGDAPGEAGGTLFTPGVNLWLGGLNRISVNYDIWSSDGGEDAESLKVQFQIAF